MTEESLVSEWLAAFGSSAVHPRVAIDHGIESNRSLLAGILEVAEVDPAHPHPDALGAWLARNENRFITDRATRAVYRFSRLGRRWRLLPVPDDLDAEVTEAA